MFQTTLHLAKQNFKFSAAHFLIFDEQNAERLHGHNYRVEVDIAVKDESQWEGKGFSVDFNVFKKTIKKHLDHWDEMVLLPALHPDMKVKEVGPSLEIRFRDRFYVFPANEVHLLPMSNTSVEQLSKFLAEIFVKDFQGQPIRWVRVLVEETPGQSACTQVDVKV